MLLHQQTRMQSATKHVARASISGREPFPPSRSLRRRHTLPKTRMSSRIFAPFWKFSSFIPSPRLTSPVAVTAALRTQRDKPKLCHTSPSLLIECLPLWVLVQVRVVFEHCRFEIIKIIVELANAMSLDLPFVTYDHNSPSHRLNAVRFVKKLKPTGYHWIPMAYCLAIEHMVCDPSSAYTD